MSKENAISSIIGPNPTYDYKYQCQSCDYSEHSITHAVGCLIDWIRGRKNISRCPHCGEKLKLVPINHPVI